MTKFEQIKSELVAAPKTWLVTGVAGFIGSNLLENVIKTKPKVVGLDNFATGHQRNLDEVRTLITETQWNNFRFVEGDISNYADWWTCCYWCWSCPAPGSSGLCATPP